MLRVPNTDRQQRLQATWWFLAGAVTGIIVTLTLLPGSPAPYRWAANQTAPWLDRGILAIVLNVALFVPLGLVLGTLGKARLLWLAPLFSVVIETLQWAIPERRPDPLDLVANSLGAALGYAIAAGTRRFLVRRRRHRSRAPERANSGSSSAPRRVI